MLLCAGLQLRLGRRRRQNSEGRSKAESYPLTPFARGLPGFCTEGRKPQDASRSCDNQDGWSPHCIKPPQTCWSWGPRVLSGLVSQETRPRSQGRGPPTTSSAPRLHFSGGPTKQDTWLSSGLGQGLFPGQSVVKLQRAGAARGPGHPGGVKAQGCGAPRGERLNFCP